MSSGLNRCGHRVGVQFRREREQRRSHRLASETVQLRRSQQLRPLASRSVTRRRSSASGDVKSMPAIPLTVYTRVPDPDSDAELGHLEEGDAATSAGRVSERSRLWPLGIAFALGVLLSSTVFVLLNIGVNTGNRLAGVSAAVEGEVKTQTFYRPAPSESPTPTSAVTTSIAQPGPNLDPLTFLMHFDSEPAMNEAPAIEPPECPLKIQYTADTSIAEAIVYNADFYSGPGDDSRKKQRAERPWQKLVIWGSESAPNRPSLERYFNSVRANGTSDMYDAAMSCECPCSALGLSAFIR